MCVTFECKRKMRFNACMRQLVPLLNPAIFYAAKFLRDKSSLGLHDMGSTIDAGENNDAMQMHPCCNHCATSVMLKFYNQHREKMKLAFETCIRFELFTHSSMIALHWCIKMFSRNS